MRRRYNQDGYGEHADGSPFDGTGIGRAWPLLTGERAHYEFAAGNRKATEMLLRIMENSADPGGLIPEQTWDQPDIPEHELFFGRPSGAARPLVWAHAECVKLIRSLRDGRVFDQPPQPAQRYLVEQKHSPYMIWAFNNKTRSIPNSKDLRISLLAPATIHWSSDDWHTAHDTSTRPTGLGTHIADLPTSKLSTGAYVFFTFYWPESGHWECADFSVYVE